MLSNGFFKTTSFTSSHINSLVCATSNEIVVNKINCNITFSDLDGMYNVVLCTENCTSTQVAVFGTSVYSENSSVCRSMMHSGQYTNIDGYYLGKIQVNASLIQEFVGSEQNKVNSKPIKKQMKGFTVSKITEECPAERVKKLSYIQQKSDLQSVNMDDPE